MHDHISRICPSSVCMYTYRDAGSALVFSSCDSRLTPPSSLATKRSACMLPPVIETSVVSPSFLVVVPTAPVLLVNYETLSYCLVLLFHLSWSTTHASGIVE